MGFFDKVKNMMGVPDDSDYEDDGVDYQGDDGEMEPQDDDYMPEPEPEPAPKPSKLVNIAAQQPQVVLLKPEQFSEVTDIADHINDKHTVVLNLESTSKELTRRIIDFVAGAAYANHGRIDVVSSGTYIVTPYYVGVSGDMINDLQDGGVPF